MLCYTCYITCNVVLRYITYLMLCYITCYLKLCLCYVITCYLMLCYVTVQLVQKGQCNGKSRPKAADIVEVMVKLQRWVRTAHQIGTDYGLFEGVAVRCIVLFSWYLWHRPRYLFD